MSSKIPSLADSHDRRVTCAEWFAQRPRIAQELSQFMDKKGAATTYLYLVQNFQFPFKIERLRRFSKEAGWLS